MPLNSEFLFVYGLLKSGYANEASILIQENATFVGNGQMTGVLFDMGSYPGAVYIPESPLKVFGEIYHITKNNSALLTRLDHFEGINPAYSEPYEYKREIIPVTLNNEIYHCWCFQYNLEWSDFRVIESGLY